MEKIDRELLIKEISSRLPYGIKAQVLGWDEEKGEVEVPLKVYSINTDGYLSFEYNHYSVETVYVEDCHLYLRPMSSMTKEEKKELQEIAVALSYNKDDIIIGAQINSFRQLDGVLDLFNSHHLDWGGLTEKDLALEAPNDIYNHPLN